MRKSARVLAWVLLIVFASVFGVIGLLIVVGRDDERFTAHGTSTRALNLVGVTIIPIIVVAAIFVICALTKKKDPGE